MSVANRIGHTGWPGPDAFRMAQRILPLCQGPGSETKCPTLEPSGLSFFL